MNDKTSLKDIDQYFMILFLFDKYLLFLFCCFALKLIYNKSINILYFWTVELKEFNFIIRNEIKREN